MATSPLPDPKKFMPQSWMPGLLLLIGPAVLIVVFFVVAPALSTYLHQPRLPSTMSSMKQMGIVLKMYTIGAAGNRYPALAGNQTTWSLDLASIYPRFLTDPRILVSGQHPHHRALSDCLVELLARQQPDIETAAGLMGMNYAYLPVALQNVNDFHAFLNARGRGLLESDTDLIKIPGRETPLYRVRDLPGCTFMGPRPEDGPGFPLNTSFIPVLVEIASWRYKSSADKFTGAHVLYMDGHVERVPLGTFPVVPEVMDVLGGAAPESAGGSEVGRI